jgi:uncharacterized protein (TIGR02246 family)
MRKPFLAVTLLTLGTPLWAADSCVTLDNKAVAALFDDWNFALSSLDASKVTQRYWPNAVLLPTVSNTPRTSAAMISDYFEHYLVKRPRGHIDTRTIQTGCNMAVDMGTYTFSLMDDKGTTTEEAARYTFVYQYRDGAWKILHHHSSAMPEAGASFDVKAIVASDEAAAPEPAPRKLANLLSRRERKAPRKENVAPPKLVAAPVVEAKPVPAPVAKVEPAPVKTAAVAQPPTDAKQPAEVRTAMFANLTSSPPPSKFYPPEALRHKEHGSVNLKVCADGQGAVSDSLEVLRSSGSKLLDEAAMTWARAVTWVPATFNRQRVEGCAKVDVSFEPPPV